MTSLLMSQIDRERAEKSARLRNIGYSYIFLLPYLILLAMFGIIPISYAFGLSFIDTIDYCFLWRKKLRLCFC